MMNGMMFGGEGPIMQGTWYNPHTGDAFTVRDSFFEDNQYVVTTTDGRYLQYNQLQNYIQSDMKLEDLKNMKIEKTTQKSNEIPPEVAGLIDGSTDPYSDMLLPEDAIITQPKLGNIYKDDVKIYDTPVGQFTVARNAAPAGTTMNEAIIEKALKNTSLPEFEVCLKWNEYPSKQIEMLKDIMDISEEEIIDWYLDNININDVVEKLSNAIKDRITGKYLADLIESMPKSRKNDSLDNFVRMPCDPNETVTALYNNAQDDNSNSITADNQKPKKTVKTNKKK